MRFVVVKDGRIRVVSSSPISSNDGDSILVPQELENIESTALMSAYIVKDNKLIRDNKFKLAKNTRLAFVGNWKMRCGISTYSEKLWPHVASQVADWRIFAEKNTSPTGPLNWVGNEQVESSRIIECWNRGEPLDDLIAHIKEFKPDVVWIQHEYGLWPNARHWLAFLSQLSDTRVIVTLHSVYKHMDKLVNEAAIPEIIVHLDGAKHLLQNYKHVPGSVFVMSHGCDPCDDQTRLWNIYKSDQTFVQFGFGFRYKGWENSIRVVAELKKKYPDVFFTGLFSESPFCVADHLAYYADLLRLIDELDVKNNVALIRGFQSEESLNAYLRTNKAVVFPYVSHPDHEVFGASGAARYAMSKNVPVITTSVNHFSDIPTIKADSIEAIAESLDDIFSNRQKWNEQVNKQIIYTTENSWKNVANLFINILENNFKH